MHIKPMLPRLAFALTSLFILALGAPVQAEALKIRVASEGAYPPFNYIDKTGQLGGFDVDIAKALCKAMQAECSFVAAPWSDIITGLTDNKYDMVVASMAYTEERGKLMAFSDSYYRSHSNFVGDPAKYTAISPEALKGKRIAVGDGTIQAQFLAKVYPDSKLILAKDQPAAAKLLIDGKADLMLADAIELLSFLQTPEGANFDYIGDPVTSDFLQSTSHITARKGDTALIGKVNAALKQIRLDGTYERVNQAYFPFSIY